MMMDNKKKTMNMMVSFTVISEITTNQDQVKLILNYNNATNPMKNLFKTQQVFKEILLRSMNKHKTSINVR